MYMYICIHNIVGYRDVICHVSVSVRCQMSVYVQRYKHVQVHYLYMYMYVSLASTRYMGNQ